MEQVAANNKKQYKQEHIEEKIEILLFIQILVHMLHYTQWRHIREDRAVVEHQPAPLLGILPKQQFNIGLMLDQCSYVVGMLNVGY